MTPIYVWHCVKCGMKIERFRHGAHDQPPKRQCHNLVNIVKNEHGNIVSADPCGGNMNLVINPPTLQFIGDWETNDGKEADDG